MKTLNALVNLKKELHAELIKNDDFKLYTKICGLIDELNYKPPVVVKAIIHKPVAKSSKNRKNSPLNNLPFRFHAIDGSLKDIGDGKLVSFIRKL